MAKIDQKKTEYVLLPIRGTHSEDMTKLGLSTPSFTRTLRARLKASSASGVNALATAKKPSINILHSTSPTGAKLVSATSQELAALRIEEPSVRAVPVVVYSVMRSPRIRAKKPTKSAAPAKAAKAVATQPLLVKIVDPVGKAIKGALVVALNDEIQQIGADGTTNAKGEVRLKLPGGPKVQVLMVYSGATGHWGRILRNVKLTDGYSVQLNPVDLAQDDFVTRLYGSPKLTDGEGVIVGVIDTGVDGQHPDLKVQHSRAFVTSEQDAGDGSPGKKDGEHGTHVAGLVASRGHGAKRHHAGRAPAVTLNSYRVFPQSGDGAMNYDILRAIEAAVDDGCDLINLSLGAPDPDEAVRDAIKEAFDKGTVCIAAAGNDGRQPLLFPARWSEVISITAIGEKGTYPQDSTETLDEFAPYTTSVKNALHKRRYAARFTNIGPEVRATAPGVGIVSTLPGSGYGVMSGTSMSSPVACGLLAAALSKKPKILKMARTKKRAIEIQRLFFSLCSVAGFTQEIEGQGLPN